MSRFRPISVSLLPNFSSPDLVFCRRLLRQPRLWRRGPAIGRLEKKFASLFPGCEAVSFLSGRTALLAILKSLNIGPSDEVLVPSFTCVVVPNAVLAAGAKPVYVDLDLNSFNLDPKKASFLVGPKTKAIIVQHTFGFPSALKPLLALAKQKNLKIIEDCAHGIDLSYQGKKLGMFGDAALFSFGRDKAVSSVFGGIALTRHPALARSLRRFQHRLSFPSLFFIFRQLIYPPLFNFFLEIYNFLSLGKLFLVVSQKTGLLLKPVFPQEKKGCPPPVLMARLPNALAALALFQLRRLSLFNRQRVKLVKFYVQNLSSLPVGLPEYRIEKNVFPLLRFTILTEKSQELYLFAKKRGVLLNNWYYPPLSPAGVDYQKLNYSPCSCPRAEAVAPQVVNLPTHPGITSDQAMKVVKIIQDFFAAQK